jgi:hypothetical protein
MKQPRLKQKLPTDNVTKVSSRNGYNSLSTVKPKNKWRARMAVQQNENITAG